MTTLKLERREPKVRRRIKSSQETLSSVWQVGPHCKGLLEIVKIAGAEKAGAGCI